MAFIQDPRLRQRWNQLSHTTEAVTSDAAAGIWTFGHRYVNPCLAGLAGAVDGCVSVCLGDREERARRARERDRGARGSRVGTSGSGRGVEYSFDFYDDWEEEFAGLDDYDDEGEGEGAGSGGGGLFLRGEDWDRLLAGTGARGQRGGSGGGGDGEAGGVADQPRRKRGMSYGTRGVGGGRRKVAGEEDPNVIPRTAPLGFLGRLPFKIVGSLRYKPSAANLKEHPGGGGLTQGYHADAGGVGRGGEEHEHEPLLGTSDEEDLQRQHRRSPPKQTNRARSDTTTSGETSSSYRSRGDLFPSDGEGEEDAVPLDDEFTMELDRVDDRSSNRTRSSKGKRPADRDKGLSRTVSRTTMSSINTRDEVKGASSLGPSPFSIVEDEPEVPSLEDLQREEEQAEREEAEEYERKRRAASQLALRRGLSKDDAADLSETLHETKEDSSHPTGELVSSTNGTAVGDEQVQEVEETKTRSPLPEDGQFVPARLPRFG